MSISVTDLSEAGVHHLINMKKLHTLEFDDISIHSEKQIPDSIIAVAGEVPSLRNFKFRCAIYQNQFVEDFGEKYPGKVLLVSQIM